MAPPPVVAGDSLTYGADLARPAIVLVDVEPDARLIDAQGGDPWRGFDRAWSLLQRFREDLAPGGSSARFSWFLRIDPQIRKAYGSAAWVVEASAERMAHIQALGDSIGVHPHAWRWSRSSDGWINDLADPDWPLECLDVALRGYEEALGSPCEIHRFGDRFLSDPLVAELARRGVTRDFTIEPGRPRLPGLLTREITSGWIPAYPGSLRTPYQPSPRNYLEAAAPGETSLWLVPLSMGALPWPVAPVVRTIKRWRGFALEDPAIYTMSLGQRPSFFRLGLRQNLGTRSGPLTFILRTGDLMTPGIEARLVANLALLLRVASARSLQFISATDWTGQQAESSS